MHVEVKPLIEQFEDHLYPVLVKIEYESKLYEEIVIFEHDRIIGKFDFGKLDQIMPHLRQVEQNAIKNSIKAAVFGNL